MPKDLTSLEGKLIVVTGAGVGIGRSVALEAARRGADVALHYSSSDRGAKDAAEQIVAMGRRVTTVQGDLSRVDECRRVLDESAEFLGGLDALVSNAGISPNDDFQDVTEEQKNVYHDGPIVPHGRVDYLLANYPNMYADLSLARGLSYYTGAIIEVVSTEYEIGSVCGGGRYDDLTGIFGLKDISGVGVSFGADRIYDAMLELRLFPDNLLKSTQVMFANFGAEEGKYCLSLLDEVRKAEIHAEIYPDPAKIKKQMSYANNKRVQFVALVGEEEIKNQVITLRSMETGKQETLTLKELIAKLKVR